MYRKLLQEVKLLTYCSYMFDPNLSKESGGRGDRELKIIFELYEEKDILSEANYQAIDLRPHI